MSKKNNKRPQETEKIKLSLDEENHLKERIESSGLSPDDVKILMNKMDQLLKLIES